MWAPDADLFPRRPRRSSGQQPPQRRSSATSRLEERRRDLPPVAPSSSGLWAFNSSSEGFSTSGFSTKEEKEGPPGLSGAKPMDHGVIGSYSSGESTARMLWNRPEREEEEREEEALPSYLSYLQAPVVSEEAAEVDDANDQLEEKSKELAKALQSFVAVQLQGKSGVNSVATSCNCEKRLAELEKKMELLQNGGDDAGSALGDRVSTLEGRQSAFQSQLAQISKVLGVPVGKHGKSSQLKTLVQTLREEIDAKVQAAVAEVEAACIASAKKHAEELIAEVSSSSPAGEASTPLESKDHKQANGEHENVSGLPFSTVLNALAEEHEASLTRLSTHFDERLRLEGSQRIALEGRVRARLGELEEWLQQVEGELGGSHFEPSGGASAASIAAMTEELSKVQTQLSTLESSWQHQRKEADKLSLKLEKLPSLEEIRAQMDKQTDELTALRENLAGMETVASTTREETRSVARTSQGLKLIVEKLVRDTGSAEELLQQYVSTITHQVASVTRQYVSVRIRDNNRLLDATLRARVPDYVANESESFLLVRPETKKDADAHSLAPEGHDAESDGNFSFVLREDDEDGIRRLLNQRSPSPSTINTTISADASAGAVAAGATSA